MRSHKEVVERLEIKHQQYETKRKEKISKIITISSFVVLAAVLIPLGIYLGGIKKPTPSTPASATATPGATGAATPTQEIALTATPTPDPASRTIETVSEGDFRDDMMPNPGVLYVGTTFLSMVQNETYKDALFHARISISLDWRDARIIAFKEQFKKENTDDPVYKSYNEGYDSWEREVYYPSLSPDSDGKDDRLALYSQYWREQHGEEEWLKLVKILDAYKNERNLRWEYLKPVYQSELDRIKEAGMQVLAEEDASIDVLMTAEQFNKLFPPDNFSYEVQWAKHGLPLIDGYEIAPPIPVTVPMRPIVLAGGKLDESLHGEYEESGIAKVYVVFGNAWEEGQKLLKERYPEEYAAYMWLKNEENPVENDDPRVEPALRGADLHNSLPQTWELEQEEKFFTRHPEWRQYRTAEVMHQMYLEVPYSLISEIAKDEGVVRISRVPDESRYVVEIGKLNGTPVYDMRGYGILEATDPEAENTAD